MPWQHEAASLLAGDCGHNPSACFICHLHGEGRKEEAPLVRLCSSHKSHHKAQCKMQHSFLVSGNRHACPAERVPLSRARSSLRCRDCASACCAAAVDAVGKAPSSPYPPRPSCTVSTHVRHWRCGRRRIKAFLPIPSQILLYGHPTCLTTWQACSLGFTQCSVHAGSGLPLHPADPSSVLIGASFPVLLFRTVPRRHHVSQAAGNQLHA